MKKLLLILGIMVPMLASAATPGNRATKNRIGRGDEEMKIYGVVDEKGEKVSDFILHTPSDCAVICILGSISTEALAKHALDD